MSEAIAARDADAVRNEIELQIQGGAVMLDVNGGSTPETEKDNVLWLAEITAAATSAPLCIDSANPEVIEGAVEAALRVRGASVPNVCETEPGVPWLMINSISAESERYEKILPLVKKYNCAVAALCLSDEGMPSTAEARVAVGAALVEKLQGEGVSPERVYLDPLVLPVGVDTGNGRAVIDAVAELKRRIPGVRSVCGLSNVSFGLPGRGLLNRIFLSLLIGAGLDAAIVDTSNQKLMSAVFAAMALCDRDAYCADYIGAFRKNILDV